GRLGDFAWDAAGVLVLVKVANQGAIGQSEVFLTSLSQPHSAVRVQWVRSLTRLLRRTSSNPAPRNRRCMALRRRKALPSGLQSMANSNSSRMQFSELGNWWGLAIPDDLRIQTIVPAFCAFNGNYFWTWVYGA